MSEEVDRLLEEITQHEDLRARLRDECMCLRCYERRRMQWPPAWPRSTEEVELRGRLLQSAERMRLARERKSGFVDGLYFAGIVALIGVSFALFITAAR